MSPVNVRHLPSAPEADDARAGWRQRLPVLVLVLVGLVVAVDLTLVQLRVLPPWEPLFGDGTHRVLFSGLARSVPIPDASLGAAAYALEALLVLPGGADRWRTAPWWPAALGALTLAMAAGGVVLVLAQAFVIGSFCTLCLVSAAVSWAAAAVDFPELRAAFGRLRDQSEPSLHH